MTDTEIDTDTKQVSQKADALDRFTKGKTAGFIYAPYWNVFRTERVELQTDNLGRHLRCLEVWNEHEYAGNTDNGKQLFVRACPLHPRPGVLESTAVKSLVEMEEVIDRITEQMLGPDPSSTPLYEHGLCDPDGCIIVQPYCDADASAVVSPYAHAVIGAGHDGVTAARDGLQIVLDLRNRTDDAPREALDKLDIDPAKIQLEFVSKLRNSLDTVVRGSVKDDARFDRNHLVQLRGCPDGIMPIKPAPHPFTISGSVAGGKVEVTQVITLGEGGDEEMAQLELTLREMDDINGVVVAHPTGSQGAHHAGQCLVWGVSYVISDKPKVGDTWVEVDGWVIDDPTIEPAPFDHYHWHEHFMQGLGVGLTKFTRQYGWLSNHFHQYMGSNVMRSPQDTAYFAGVFAGYLPNAIFAVSMGEFRHARGQKKNTLPVDMATFMALNTGLPPEQHGVSGNRKHYYSLIEERPLTISSLRGQLNWLVNMYNTGWSGGYGGKNYAESTQKGIGILDAVVAYTSEPDEKKFMTLLGAVNEAENIVHNNGFFLNKFLNKRAFDVGTDKNPKTEETYLTSFRPDDFFAIFYTAQHAYQYRNMKDSELPTLTETEDITTYANKWGSYVMSKSQPLYTRTDLPAIYHTFEDDISTYNYLHPSNSKYTSNPDYFVACGIESCDTCIANNVATLNNKLTLPLPNLLPEYDMTMPTSVPVDEMPSMLIANGATDFSDMLFTFKTHHYGDMEKVAGFYKVVNDLQLQNSNNPMVMKCLKHYANYIGNMPTAKKNELIILVNGDE